MASAEATIDRDEIRRWVEDRGGFPAHVPRTEGEGDPGVLRIDYPGFSGEDSLERIDWEQWFKWFDRDNLAFLYQPEGENRFSKLVDRDSVDVTSSRRGSSTKRAAAGKASSRKSSSRKASSAQASSAKASSKKAPAGRSSSKRTATKRAASTKRTAAAKRT